MKRNEVTVDALKNLGYKATIQYTSWTGSRERVYRATE